jgi:hypothetical protein
MPDTTHLTDALTHLITTGTTEHERVAAWRGVVRTEDVWTWLSWGCE